MQGILSKIRMAHDGLYGHTNNHSKCKVKRSNGDEEGGKAMASLFSSQLQPGPGTRKGRKSDPVKFLPTLPPVSTLLLVLQSK